MSSFKKRAEALVIEGSGWENKVSAHRNDLNSQIVSLINNCKDKILAKLQQNA
jgi:hypothetical protein